MPLLSYSLSQHGGVISSTTEAWRAESNSVFQQGIRLDSPAWHTGVIIDQCTELIQNQRNNSTSEHNIDRLLPSVKVMTLKKHLLKKKKRVEQEKMSERNERGGEEGKGQIYCRRGRQKSEIFCSNTK